MGIPPQDDGIESNKCGAVISENKTHTPELPLQHETNKKLEDLVHKTIVMAPGQHSKGCTTRYCGIF